CSDAAGYNGQLFARNTLARWSHGSKKPPPILTARSVCSPRYPAAWSAWGLWLVAAEVSQGTSSGRGTCRAREGNGPFVHHLVSTRRPGPARHIRYEAGGAGGNSRRVSADRHQLARLPYLRAHAAARAPGSQAGDRAGGKPR